MVVHDQGPLLARRPRPRRSLPLQDSFGAAHLVRALILGAPALILTLWLGSAALLDLIGRRQPPSEPYDAIIVAGCRVEPDGKPSMALARRVRRGVALWEQGQAPVIVFTGGVGRFPPAEADAAAELARALGVPPAAIVIERASTSTETNARLAAARLAEAGRPVHRVVVVTDSYHVFRAARVFGRFFDQVDGAGSVPGAWVRLRGSLREVGAVGWYAVTGRLGSGAVGR